MIIFLKLINCEYFAVLLLYRLFLTGDRPGPPGAPVVHNLRRDVYQVMWESSAENGAQLELYSLEGRNVGNRLSRREANSTFDLEDSLFEGWTSHYNGTGKLRQKLSLTLFC